MTLLEANMALNDGLSHTLVKALPEGFALQQIKVALPTEDDAPRLELCRLELSAAPPEVFSTEVSADAVQWPAEDLLRSGAGPAASGGGALSRCLERSGAHPPRRGRASADRPHPRPPATRLRGSGLAPVAMQGRALGLANGHPVYAPLALPEA